MNIRVIFLAEGAGHFVINKKNVGTNLKDGFYTVTEFCPETSAVKKNYIFNTLLIMRIEESEYIDPTSF